MLYHTECPYCGGQVVNHKYVDFYDVPEWAFYCNCAYGTLMFEEAAAYEDYLLAREEAHFTNFDKYFGSTVSHNEFDRDLDDYCISIDGDCEKCKWAKIAKIISSDIDEADGSCYDFIRWLDEPLRKS